MDLRHRLGLKDFVSRDTNLLRLLVICAAVFVTMTLLNPGRFLSTLNVD